MDSSVREALWLQNVRRQRGLPTRTIKISIGEPNEGCISILDDWIVKERSKHIYIRYQMIVENIRKGVKKVIYVPKKYMVAYIMTNALRQCPSQYILINMSMGI